MATFRPGALGPAMHRRKQVQRSHDLSNVASNTKEAVPVCQQQENTQPALIRRKSTSGLL